MSAKSERLKRLKKEHPICYFCATNPTETKDHVPSRECFKDRIAPEGYAFPACKRCNHASSQLEQVVALYIMLANHDDPKPSQEQMLRLAKGVENNNPDLLPTVSVGGTAARRHFREKAHGSRARPDIC